MRWRGRRRRNRLRVVVTDHGNWSSLCVVAEARTEEGCFGHCRNIVVAHGHHHGWWRGALTALCVDVVMADGRHTHGHYKSSGGALAALWARTVTLSRRGRDRVTTRVVAESKAASDEQGDGSAMDLMHHTTSSFIPSTYAICAERYRGKSSNKLTLPEIPHFCNHVMDALQIRLPFPGRRRKYEKYLRGVPGQNDLAEGRPQEIDAL